MNTRWYLDSGASAKMELRNVLHILRLRKNLVSWLCLHRNGWGMSHPEEDEMVLSNSKQGDSFKVITKNEQLPLIPLEVHCPLLCNFMQVANNTGSRSVKDQLSVQAFQWKSSIWTFACSTSQALEVSCTSCLLLTMQPGMPE